MTQYRSGVIPGMRPGVERFGAKMPMPEEEEEVEVDSRRAELTEKYHLWMSVKKK